jgi:hypothetical protein
LKRDDVIVEINGEYLLDDADHDTVIGKLQCAGLSFEVVVATAKDVDRIRKPIKFNADGTEMEEEEGMGDKIVKFFSSAKAPLCDSEEEKVAAAAGVSAVPVAAAPAKAAPAKVKPSPPPSPPPTPTPAPVADAAAPVVVAAPEGPSAWEKMKGFFSKLDDDEQKVVIDRSDEGPLGLLIEKMHGARFFSVCSAPRTMVLGITSGAV